MGTRRNEDYRWNESWEFWDVEVPGPIRVLAKRRP